MSNPCVNRWGLNSFWQHYWYSDSCYALNVRQDKVFIDLVQTYVTYGSGTPVNTFWNKYWYKTQQPNKPHSPNTYYKWITVTNQSTGELYQHRFRLEGEELFHTRVSILRFDSWILLNLYWFQPDKRRKRRAARTHPHTYTEALNCKTTSMSNFRKLRSTIYSTTLKTTNCYNF